MLLPGVRDCRVFFFITSSTNTEQNWTFFGDANAAMGSEESLQFEGPFGIFTDLQLHRNSLQFDTDDNVRMRLELLCGVSWFQALYISRPFHNASKFVQIVTLF